METFAVEIARRSRRSRRLKKQFSAFFLVKSAVLRRRRLPATDTYIEQMMKNIGMSAVFCCVFMGCAPKSPAQTIRKSQLASVMQMVGDTRIEIIYHRPVARGRELFGALVPWGRIWSPSADTAAIFRTTTDLEVGSTRLPAGRYSIWAIPDRESWTIIFSSVVPVFHVRYPEGRDVLRVKATPHPGEHMETLAFYFPMVDADSAVLNLHWGKTVVPLSLRAQQRPAR